MDHQPSYSESEILAGFLHREEKALEQLHMRLFQPLCYFAQKLVVHQQAAEEIVADVFVKIWRSPTVFDSFAHLRGYLFEAVKNESLNTLKKDGRYARHLRHYGEIIQLNIGNADNELLETTALEIIFNIAEDLPAECKKVFDLLYRSQMDYKEVAQQLQLNVQTVRNQRSRAIAFIRSRLKSHSMMWLLIFLR